MGAGKDNCPLMSWISTGNADNSSADVEILYANYWYQVGTKGLMVKFSDGYFSDNNGTVTSWTIPCTAPAAADSSGNTTAAIGAARYIWGSSRGDDFSDVQGTLTSSTTPTELGSRGLYITFSGTNVLTRQDSFYVLASPPLPKSNGYGITNLSYGNVTVSTDSVVKCVMFEIMSGAVELSTVKFGLQSHGSFQHHYAGNADTEFRFGTVGPGAVGGVSPVDGLEWRVGVTPSDIARDVAIDSMHSSKQNLTVVSDADSSQDVGSSSDAGMCSDPIWLNIKLGNSEVGANSTINYRIYFDYS